MDFNTVFAFSFNTLIIVFMCLVFLVITLIFDNKKSNKKSLNDNGNIVLKKPPSPIAMPIFGNLYNMAGYEIPYQSFGVMAEKFGPIFGLKLGVQPAVVVNGIDNIKEVLIGKSAHFDSRPNFKRYHDLFSGNKENSLAFCNWSDMQKKRRDMLVPHSFPRNFSIRFDQLNEIISSQTELMTEEFQMLSDANIEIKPIILRTCANIFTQYFCSKSFSSTDNGFQKMINNFDKIFYEVNQGYLADFIPMLLPIFHKKNLKQMENWSHEIRSFILENIIENRKENWSKNDEQIDYVDTLIEHVQENLQPKMEWDTALFALEDIIGGHSAVGNFLVKVLGYVAQHSNVQKMMQQEIDEILMNKSDSSSSINLCDRSNMPYIDAVILEALRLIASPIVPHVANQDSTIGEYLVEKDTMIFLNNYDLSMSENLWDEPKKFQPERFLQNGRIVKPDYFLPFGGGRRSCMGYKMVQFLSFSILTSIMQNYDIQPIAKINVEVGSLAIGEDSSYTFKFIPRDI